MEKMFGLNQDDFDNINKMSKLPEEEQNKLIDEALNIMQTKEKISLNWFGRSGKLISDPWFIIEFMGQKYGDCVNSIGAEYLLCGICCEHSVSIIGQEDFVKQYGDVIIKITSLVDNQKKEITLKEVYEMTKNGKKKS